MPLICIHNKEPVQQRRDLWSVFRGWFWASPLQLISWFFYMLVHAYTRTVSVDGDLRTLKLWHSMHILNEMLNLDSANFDFSRTIRWFSSTASEHDKPIPNQTVYLKWRPGPSALPPRTPVTCRPTSTPPTPMTNVICIRSKAVSRLSRPADGGWRGDQNTLQHEQRSASRPTDRTRRLIPFWFR